MSNRHHWSSPDKNPGDGRLTFARRWFWHWGPDEHREDAHLDVYANRKPDHGWGFQLRFDGPDAETPIDAGLFLGRWLVVFSGTSKGRRLNRALRVRGWEKGDPYQAGSREIEFRLQSGRDCAGQWAENFLVQWSLWTDPEHHVMGRWHRKRMIEQGRSRAATAAYEHIRRGYHHPARAVLDRILGKTVHTCEKSEPVPAVVCMPEADYPVTVTLERRTWKRPRSPRAWLRSADADVEVVNTRDGGLGFVPTGKVKYGYDDGIVSTTGGRQLTAREAADPGLWVPIGIAAFTGSVLKDRARYGYRPSMPEVTA